MEALFALGPSSPLADILAVQKRFKRVGETKGCGAPRVAMGERACFECWKACHIARGCPNKGQAAKMADSYDQ